MTTENIDKTALKFASKMLSGHYMTFELIVWNDLAKEVEAIIAHTPLNDEAEANLIRRVIKNERKGLPISETDSYKCSELIQGHLQDAKWLYEIDEDEPCMWKVIDVDGKPI